MERETVILDVDTGSDDAVAIVCAMLGEEYDLLGITTVGGNVDLEHTTDNTLRVVDACGGGVPVHMGSELPLASTLVSWGIQGMTLPHNEKNNTFSSFHPDQLPLPAAVSKPQEPRAAVWLIETLLAQPDHSVTLIPVGPETNIALAIRADDRILKKIKRVVLMGGSHDVYYPTQAAEFNIWADPEAAEILLSSGLDITMVSLDATANVLLSAEQSEMIRAIGTVPAVFVADMIDQRLKASGNNAGAALHDPLALCAAVHPEVLTDVWDTSCHIDLGRGYAYGETVLGRNYMQVKDEDGILHGVAQNVHYTRKADRDFFFRWLYGILSSHKTD